MALPVSSNPLLSILLALGQYPILSGAIRARMRQMLFERAILTPAAFEEEVREKAIASQVREGLQEPLIEEPLALWDRRVDHVRNQLTDLYFSQHLGYEPLEVLISEVLREKGITDREQALAFNPELSPQEMVFEQAMTIEKLPPKERVRFEARLQELKVVLIRTLISDQLPYINIAREYFTIADLVEIRRRKIGAGKIGGKAAGMLLAYRVLQNNAPEALLQSLHPADSYFLGSDEMYRFMSTNNLVHWNDQKYKTEPEMHSEYAQILADFEAGEFTPDILEKLQVVLANVGDKPLIVRSSSLLEDNFGASFAGKYDSIFVPNQGKPKENLRALVRAIGAVYASTLNPDALLYRRRRGLQDYDERMGILIQRVQGQKLDHYYLPDGAGVAFSRNLYRWAPQIRREDGFVRLVWGLGTRAVDRVGNDYPRLIALSHPTLRPSNEALAMRRYSQQFVDVLDLQDNTFKTLPISEVITSNYEPARYLAQVEQEGYFTSLRSAVLESEASDLVLTFDGLLRRTSFAEDIRQILQVLELGYRSPVDMEFCFLLKDLDSPKPRLSLTILQCRPQSHLESTESTSLPQGLKDADIAFSTNFMVPQGRIDRVDYVLYVPPQAYFALPSQALRAALGRAIGELNENLKDESFICIGPGRWGSSNSDLGVPIHYGDIYHAQALVELAGQGIGLPPEPSLGTHFFQDLLEAQIYPLAIYLDDPANAFNKAFFEGTANCTADWLKVDERLRDCLKLIRVADFRPGASLRVVMDDEKNKAVGFFVKSPSLTLPK